MSRARKKLDWETQKEFAIDPVQFEKVLKKAGSSGSTCTMCGEYCALKVASQYVEQDQ